jgi:hypothetical protein
MPARSKLATLAPLVAPALAACTSLHYEDAAGRVHHVGLVVERTDELAAGSRTTVTGLGLSWWWLADFKGLALGASWRGEERPELTEVATGVALQVAVEAAFAHEPEPLERPRTRWRALWLSDDRRDVARTTTGNLGLAALHEPPGGRLVALYGESTRLGALGAGWNSVLLRTDVAGTQHDSSRAWILASTDTSRPPAAAPTHP